MSRKRNGTAPKMDARVRRTRYALGDALIALMQEEPFESITVQNVLDRAKIGRSTFYVHFRDKNDLFLSDVEDFLELMSTLLQRREEASNRVAPVRELFAHVADMRQLQAALLASGKWHDFMELAQGYFARGIEQRLCESRTRSMPAPHRKAISQAFAAALLSLMSWWLEHGTPGSPEDMDHLFHQMVWSGFSAPSATNNPVLIGPTNFARMNQHR